MTRLPDTDRARPLLGKRGAFEGVARWPRMASEMGTDEAHTPPNSRSHRNAQRVVEKVGRSIYHELRNTARRCIHKTPRSPSKPGRFTESERGESQSFPGYPVWGPMSIDVPESS